MSEPDARGSQDLQQVQRLQQAYGDLRAEIGKVIVGQEAVLEQILIGIFSRGHCLLVGVPGLAKTLMISTLARALSLSFSRIQFTPDLMPADITGTEVIQEDRGTGERRFQFIRGPIFAHVILADEINRTPPKTQSALLEAMQEHQVTAGGKRHALEEPFFVLATQNPIEQEGTYPLPEAQLDRFMFNIRVDYPSEAEELKILRLTTEAALPDVRPVLSGPDIVALQEIVRKVPIADSVLRYAMQLARCTRLGSPEAPEFVNRYLSWGAGPRASQYLIIGAKAHALLHGRLHVSLEDVHAVAHPVLRHRIILNFGAEAEGHSADAVIDRIIEHVGGLGGAVVEAARAAEATI